MLVKEPNIIQVSSIQLESVWNNYGMTAEQAKKAGMNPKMFNSFVTGDKSSIEMAAVANASGLKCPNNGLTYPPIASTT